MGYVTKSRIQDTSSLSPVIPGEERSDDRGKQISTRYNFERRRARDLNASIVMHTQKAGCISL